MTELVTAYVKEREIALSYAFSHSRHSTGNGGRRERCHHIRKIERIWRDCWIRRLRMVSQFRRTLRFGGNLVHRNCSSNVAGTATVVMVNTSLSCSLRAKVNQLTFSTGVSHSTPETSFSHVSKIPSFGCERMPYPTE